MIKTNRAIKKAPISRDSFASVESPIEDSLCQIGKAMIPQYKYLSSFKLPRRAAGETCTRTPYLTGKGFLYLNFGGKRPPGQYYLNTYEY